jgi:hypothetical protein
MNLAVLPDDLFLDKDYLAFPLSLWERGRGEGKETHEKTNHSIFRFDIRPRGVWDSRDRGACG